MWLNAALIDGANGGNARTNRGSKSKKGVYLRDSEFSNA
jgi:hypothetical protein